MPSSWLTTHVSGSSVPICALVRLRARLCSRVRDSHQLAGAAGRLSIGNPLPQQGVGLLAGPPPFGPVALNECCHFVLAQLVPARRRVSPSAFQFPHAQLSVFSNRALNHRGAAVRKTCPPRAAPPPPQLHLNRPPAFPGQKSDCFGRRRLLVVAPPKWPAQLVRISPRRRQLTQQLGAPLVEPDDSACELVNRVISVAFAAGQMASLEFFAPRCRRLAGGARSSPARRQSRANRTAHSWRIISAPRSSCRAPFVAA